MNPRKAPPLVIRPWHLAGHMLSRAFAFCRRRLVRSERPGRTLTIVSPMVPMTILIASTVFGTSFRSGLLKKAFRSLVDELRVSGIRCAASIPPLMLSLSKHERGLVRRGC